MTLLEQYFDCMQRADAVGLADLFNDVGVLHDASWTKVGEDTLHLSGKMAIEMMVDHKVGRNRGPLNGCGIR